MRKRRVEEGIEEGLDEKEKMRNDWIGKRRVEEGLDEKEKS